MKYWTEKLPSGYWVWCVRLRDGRVYTSANIFSTKRLAAKVAESYGHTPKGEKK